MEDDGRRDAGPPGEIRLSAAASGGTHAPGSPLAAGSQDSDDASTSESEDTLISNPVQMRAVSVAWSASVKIARRLSTRRVKRNVPKRTGPRLSTTHSSIRSLSSSSSMDDPRGDYSGSTWGLGSRRSPPYHSVSRLLLATNCLVILSSVIHHIVVHVGVHGCSMDNLGQEECRWTAFMYVTMPMLVRQIVAFGVISLLLFRKLLEIRQLRRNLEAGFSGPNMLSTRQLVATAGHWTGAASLDGFTEVTDMVSDSQLMVLALVGCATIGSASAVLNTAVTAGASDAVAAVCYPGGDFAAGEEAADQLCLAGRKSFTFHVVLGGGFLTYFICSTAFMPSSLWSPVSFMAVRKTENSFMARLLRVPAIAIAASGLNSVAVVVYGAIIFSPGISSRSLWRAMLFVSPVSNLAQFGLLLYSIRWAQLRRPFSRLQRALRRAWGRLVNPSSALKGCLSRFSPLLLMWRCHHSWRYRQLAVLSCGILCFGLEVDPTSGAWIQYELWASRLLFCLLLFGSYDAEASFETLERHGAGFGLVVNAQQMRKALWLHLHGRQGGQALGRVKRYKGTLLRMSESLTVSYRWHPESVHVKGLGDINMSEWQLEELMKGIDNSGCLYVWLDVLSVPQEPGELKRVLLSRMMSVYSCSYLTLALLSCEEDTQRYHQRIWTLQEYCSASDVVVVTQEVLPDLTETGKHAVLDGEHAEVEQLRLEHLVRQAMCTPVWLMDMRKNIRDVPTEDLKIIWQTYEELSQQRFCMIEGDKIRAMYPLLFNHPADRQEELVELMDILEIVHGIPQQQQRRQLSDASQVLDSVRLVRVNAGLSSRAGVVDLPGASNDYNLARRAGEPSP